MKAAGLIGLYSHEPNQAKGIKYLEEVIELSCRRKRRLKDELLICMAYSSLFKSHLELKNYDAAIRNGIKAAVLLLEGREYGWKDFEDTGDSQRQFIINLRNLIRTHSSLDAKIAVEDKNKLDELIQKMDSYSRRN
jgi:dihydroxyacid dehydratase/phosphogluconate dehydratase